MTDELFGQVVAAYLDGLDSTVVADRLAAWGRAEGLEVATRNRIVVVSRRGRVVAAFDSAASGRGSRTAPLSRKRCWTCGALPVGTFADGSRRYDCHLADPASHVPTASTVPLWRSRP